METVLVLLPVILPIISLLMIGVGLFFLFRKKPLIGIALILLGGISHLLTINLVPMYLSGNDDGPDCSLYNRYRVEARKLSNAQLNSSAILSATTSGSVATQDAWTRYAAYFHVYEERNNMHDSDDWDVCN